MLSFIKPMTVTNRIKAIKSLVPSGTRLLDIGSDHALLPISLYQGGVITGAVITDVNEGPLKRSKEQVGRYCPDLERHANFVLSDGFTMVSEGGYDMAAVCGMGGELIARIVEQAGGKAHCPLILQPMSQQDKLRAYLWENGFEVKEELYATEGNRVYAILFAQYSGRNTEYSYEDAFLGKHRPKTAEYAAYAKKIAAAAKKRLIGLERAGNEEGASQARSLIMAAEALA